MRTAALSILLLCTALPLDAQTPDPQTTRVYLGGSFIVAEPQQDFRDHVNTSFGGSLNVLWLPATNSPLALRFEGGGIGYGSETKRVPLSPTIGGRVMVDLTTNNLIAFAHAGPQLSMTRGAVRPYIAPTAGIAYIATVSSVSGDDSSENFASDTNYDDTQFSYGATAGTYVKVSTGRTPIALDLSVRYHRNGQASYLKKGGIRDNPDGTISFDPVRSSIDMLTFQIGASFGITSRPR